MSNPRVAIVYLSYESIPYLPEVTEAWADLVYPREALRVYVVDNASKDGSAQWVRDYVLPRSGRDLPEVTLIANTENLGFAEGNNVAMRQAIDDGFDYVYLHNNDLKLHPQAIDEAVELAERDPKVGSVQSLMLLWQRPEIVNSSGGMVHFLGFGFVRDNGRTLTDCQVSDGEEVAYGSGAATLYRSSALKTVGLLDPHLFLYHEDLELGWRLRLAGYKNVLSRNSIGYHRYEFKRSVAKLYWMERNRILVHLSHLRLATLLFIVPLWIGLEAALMVFAVKGGWWREKTRAYQAICSRVSWKYIREKRHVSHQLRRVSDHEIMHIWTGKIEHQETSGPIVDRVANPILNAYFQILKHVVLW